jgi:hypothetical protein
MSYDTEEYKGYTIKIEYDESPMNPRTDWDSAGTMVCWHSRYNLGDMEDRWPISRSYQEPIDLLYELAGIDRSEYQEEQYEKTDSYSDMDKADLFKVIEEKGTIIKGLFLYDHSGITISTSSFSCRWDSGQVGWIYITKDKIEKEGWTPEQADNYLDGEVEVYDNYLTGEVYGYRITKYNKEIEDDEEVESCWGYYGDDGKESMIEECKRTIDYLVKKQEERNLLLGIQMELAL